MPTPPLSDEQVAQCITALNENGGNKSHAAKSLNMDRGTFVNRLRIAQERGLQLSEGARRTVSSAQLTGIEAKGGWIHQYDDEGKKTGTTRWSAPENDVADDMLERIADRMARVEPIAAIPAPMGAAAIT